METEILEDIGLTRSEIKIYLVLLELGISTAGPIMKKTGLQNSVVHTTLPRLVEKGFISFVKKGGVREYSATNPNNIVKFIDEKKRKFEEILPSLLERQKKVSKQEAEVYKGFKGFKNMYYKLIEDAEKGDEFLFFSFYSEVSGEVEKAYNFYKLEYQREREQLGIVVKGLAPRKIKKFLFTEKWQKKSIKFVDFPIPVNISIFKDKIVFTPWEETPICFLIHSQQLVDSFKDYFYSVWNSLEFEKQKPKKTKKT